VRKSYSSENKKKQAKKKLTPSNRIEEGRSSPSHRKRRQRETLSKELTGGMYADHLGGGRMGIQKTSDLPVKEPRL